MPSNMQNTNHSNQGVECERVQNVELIPPPSYNEATSSPTTRVTEVGIYAYCLYCQEFLLMNKNTLAYIVKVGQTFLEKYAATNY